MADAAATKDSDPDSLVERLVATADPFALLDPLTGEALTALADAARNVGREGFIAKLISVHLFRAKAHDQALGFALRGYRAQPDLEGFKNLSRLYQLAGRVEKGRRFLDRTFPDYADTPTGNDVMCSFSSHVGDVAAARRYGTRSLELKDQLTIDVPAPSYGPRRDFDFRSPRRNIIAYSLFGRDDRYLVPALHNARAIKYIYHGWTPRFYVDATVPAPVLASLREEGAEVVVVPTDRYPAARYGLFWRFFVIDDDVDFFLMRDADSIVTVREKVAVDEWLASGRHFHLMRDHPVHSELILAGMWGGAVGTIDGISDRIDRYLNARSRTLFDTTLDQQFLRTEIWPLIRGSVLMHDGQFAFGTPRDFPSVGTIHPRKHVGQNDFGFFRYRPKDGR